MVPRLKLCGVVRQKRTETGGLAVTIERWCCLPLRRVGSTQIPQSNQKRGGILEQRRRPTVKFLSDFALSHVVAVRLRHHFEAPLIDVCSEAETHRLRCGRVAPRAFCRSRLRNPGSTHVRNSYSCLHCSARGVPEPYGCYSHSQGDGRMSNVAHSLTEITLLQRMFHFQKDAANRPQQPLLRSVQSVRSIYWRVRPGSYRR